MNPEWDGRFSHIDGTNHDVEEYAKTSLKAWPIILPPTTFHHYHHLSSVPSIRKCHWVIALFANVKKNSPPSLTKNQSVINAILIFLCKYRCITDILKSYMLKQQGTSHDHSYCVIFADVLIGDVLWQAFKQLLTFFAHFYFHVFFCVQIIIIKRLD